MYTKAAAADAVAFGIIDRLRRRVMGQGSFAQVVIGIRHMQTLVPLRFENHSRGAGGLLGLSQALAPVTFSLRL
jgi:hypothetical protein